MTLFTLLALLDSSSLLAASSSSLLAASSSSLLAASSSSSLVDSFSGALAGGDVVSVLFIVFVAGVATSLTPCVYPMIAITVSVFGARQATTRLGAAKLSTAFVLGMATLFAPLGLLSAVTGVAFGSALASPWVVGALALFFVLMALSMFGAFDLTLPPALHNKLAQAGGFGVRGAFVLGLVSGLVAAPCTGPVLAVLLAWIASSGNTVLGGAAMVSYALGLGLLFWVVGTFAIALPKSGKWLMWVKSAFGVVMLALAFYFARSLLHLPLPAEKAMVWVWAGVGLVVVGIALGAVHRSFLSGATRSNAMKALGIAAMIAGILSIVGWVEALPPGAKVTWLNNLDEARAQAHELNKPLLVDFGADWCAACTELDQFVFSDPRVVQASKRFVAVRVDLSVDEATDQGWAWLSEYDQKGLPLVVLHKSNGDEHGRITSFVSAEEFLTALSEVH